jgi:hypothetical protein
MECAPPACPGLVGPWSSAPPFSQRSDGYNVMLSILIAFVAFFAEHRG